MEGNKDICKKDIQRRRMKKSNVITLITIIAVIAVAGVFFGVNYLLDAYAKYQRATQFGNQSGNQAVSPAYGLIMATMESPEESGVCGEDLEWYYKDEVLVITGTGKMNEYIYSAGSAPWNSLWNQIGLFILDEGVSSIGGAAFKDCGSMTEIVLPSSLTDIGESAFSGCGGLTQIELPVGVTGIGKSAFEGCSSLKEINIPDSVTRIGDEAFRGCSWLPDTIISIDDYAFSGCSDMTIYYSGNARDSYIDWNSSEWSRKNIVWVRQ